MDNDDTRPGAPRRAIASVDLGDMKDRVTEVCTAAGVRPSTWIRDLIWRELGAPVITSAIAPADSGDAESAGSYEVSLNGELTARLDAITKRGGFRTRAAAIRGLLEGVNVSGAAGSLSSVVAALGASNHVMVSVSRSLSTIAQKLPAHEAKLLVIDRIEIESAVQKIREHLSLAAPLVGDLRPLVKVKQEIS